MSCYSVATPDSLEIISELAVWTQIASIEIKNKAHRKESKNERKKRPKKEKKKKKKEKVNRYLQTYQEAPAGRFVCDETVVSDAATVLGCACSCWGRCRCCYHYHHHHHRCCHMLATCWGKKKDGCQNCINISVLEIEGSRPEWCISSMI